MITGLTGAREPGTCGAAPPGQAEGGAILGAPRCTWPEFASRVIDHTKRAAAAPAGPIGRTGQFEIHVAWPQVRQPTLWHELRHMLLSPHGGDERGQLQIFSVISGPGGAEPETAGRRDTPSPDGSVQHTVSHLEEGLLDGVRSGMPSGSEIVTLDMTSWAAGTTVVIVAVAFRGFELAQLGPVECRLVDPTSGRDLQTFTTPHTDRPHNCRILARISETAAGRWEVTPIGDTSVGRTLAEFVSATRRHV